MFFRRKINRHLVGITLTLIGVPLGMYLNYFYPSQWNWTTIWMAISVLLLADWKNLLRFRFPSYVPMLRLIMFFQFIMLIYGMCSTNLTTQFLSFHLYVLALCMAYASLPENVQLDSLPQYIYIISFPLVLLGYFCYSSGLMNAYEIWEMRQHGEEFALEAFTIASGTLTCMFAAICTKRERWWHKALFVVVMLIGGLTLLMTTKRTPVFVFLVGMLVVLYSKRFLRLHVKWKYILVGTGMLILFAGIYFWDNSVQKLVDRFFSNFSNGVLNLFGDTSVSDETGSAYMRVERREWAYKYIEENFSFVNYVFGAGYMTRWLDNPILQAYLDMGIIGFLFYGFLIVLFPLHVIRQHINNAALILAVLFSTYAILSILNSGHPYSYAKYVPVCFLAFVYAKERRRDKLTVANK